MNSSPPPFGFHRTLRIPSLRANIQHVERFIVEMNSELHLEDSVLDRVMISVTEAVNNGIVHGNKCLPDKFVLLTCTYEPERLEFVVQDEGPGFSPEELPDPLAENNLLKEGGRGILIVRTMMDFVEFSRTERGMQIRMMIMLRRDA